MLIAQAIVVVLSGLLLLAAYRWARQRSTTLAAIFAIGVIGRAALAIFLFAVSDFALPLLRPLQLGRGFWLLALDAEFYYDAAAAAARAGVGTINDVSASPAYVRTLATWLQLAGIHPLTAVLFNLLCYAAIATMIISGWRSHAAATVALITVTIEPALVLFGTQVLKDSFFVLGLALAVAGIRLCCDGLDRRAQNRVRSVAAGIVVVALGMYIVAGIRTYVGAFLLIAMLTAVIASFAVPNRPAAWALAFASAAFMALMVGAFARGAGPYFPYYLSIAKSVLVTPSAPLHDLDLARAGFVNSGGATSIESPFQASGPGVARRGGVMVDPGGAGRGLEISSGTRLVRLLRGALVFFVPIALLHLLSIVSFTGGRGLLFIADIDTIVMDISLIACCWVVLRGRLRPPMLPLVVFVAVFSLIAVCALAYVVTNFGTLFRLRLIATAPLWLLPALARSADHRGSPTPP